VCHGVPGNVAAWQEIAWNSIHLFSFFSQGAHHCHSTRTVHTDGCEAQGGERGLGLGVNQDGYWPLLHKTCVLQLH